VRLTSIGNHSPGSKVEFDDIDMSKPLTLLPATINYLNLYGSSAYDLDDPVYLHQYYCVPNNIDTEQEQNADDSSYRRHDEEADRDYDSSFAHRTAFIFTNDIRLNRIGNLSPGTKVVDFDPDQNKILAIPALARFLGRARDTARIRYLDKNGNDEYDYPDCVYLNYPSGRTGDGVVVNNVRLTPVNASPGP
jgi:hypothetical protein